MNAWHFTAMWGYLDKAPRISVRPGTVVEAQGPLALCVNGCHASLRAIDAFNYAPSPWVERVELGGEILTGPDKLCARWRRTLWVADATRVLHEFVIWIAEETFRLNGWNPSVRLNPVIRLKRQWLEGSGDEHTMWQAGRAPVEFSLTVRDTLIALVADTDTLQSVHIALTLKEPRVSQDTLNQELERRLMLLAPIP